MAVALFAAPCLADISRETAQRINAANELLRTGNVQDAIHSYQTLEPGAAAAPPLQYNMGVAHFRNGDLDAATRAFQETAAAIDPKVASRSRYNLGNCHYSKALSAAQQDKQAAIGHLKAAIDHYRSSVRINPDNADARANIELANNLLQQLESEEPPQQEQQQQPTQDQQQDNQQYKDQQDDNQAGESDAADQSDESNASKKSDQEDTSDSTDHSDTSESSAGADNPTDISDQSQAADQPNTAAQSNASDQSNMPQPSDASEQNNIAPQSQNHDLQNESQDKQQQPVPMGELTSGDENAATPDDATAAASMNSIDGDQISREEAMKLLQAVRDRDMLRRLRQQQRERVQRVPVDKDW